LPGELLRALRHRQRGRDRGLAVDVQLRRPGQLDPGAARPGTVVAGQPVLGDADHRPVRHLEAARLLRAAVPGRPPEHPRGAVRGGRGRRGRAGEALHRRHPARGPPHHHPGGDRAPRRGAELLHGAVPAHRPRRPRRGVGVPGPAHLHPGHRAGQSRLCGRHRGAAGHRRDGHLAGEPLPAGEELTVATATQPQPARPVEAAAEQATAIAPPTRRSRRRLWPLLGLAVGALVFLFPFYYMVIGALQREPNSDISGAFPNPANLTLDNLRNIDRAIDLPRTLLNSGIFTGGVLLSTMVLGLLAGYALARLEFRGRGMVFNAMLLILIVPFQVLMIPLYVMIVRGYLLGDTYLGMILPFAVNATAVFIFRQFFLQLPRELFESARLDGARALKILTRTPLPPARPALLTAVILTFIGPWNEFLWPFLVTKQLALQPLAVALANFISNVAARQANPFGAILAGAVVLTIPAVVLFLIFQKRFQASNLGSAIKGGRRTRSVWG